MKRLLLSLSYAPLLLGQRDQHSIRRMDADIRALAAPGMQGRRTLDPGAEEAAGYVATEFAKAGLKAPFAGSYLQKFDVIEYRPDPLARHVGVWHGRSERELIFGRDYAGSGFPETEATAGVVFAGYGITAPELGYDDYGKIDARGKFVLVFEHEPQETDPRSIFNGVGNTIYSGVTHKLLNAQKRGALALLIMPEPNRKHLSNWDRLAKLPGGKDRFRKVQIIAGRDLIPVYALSDGAVTELLATAGRKPSELQAELDRTLKPAPFEIPDTRFESTSSGTDRCLDRAIQHRQAATANVVGVIEGSDPKLRNEAVLITSHWDHLGIRDGAVLPGADDNASGTAAVIEIARMFREAGVRPKRTVVFTSFAGEETGLLGSYYYASHPLLPLARTRAVLNLDMVGRDEKPSAQTDGLMEIAADTSREFNLIGSEYSPQLRAVLQDTAREEGLKINLKWERDAALNVIARSDQYPFLLDRVPAMWIFTGFHPDYHQPTDTPEKLDYDKMARITRAVYAAARKLADTTTPPRFSVAQGPGLREQVRDPAGDLRHKP